MKKLTLGSLVAASTFMANSAFAAIDTTAAEASVADGVVAVGVIGGAFLAFTILKRVWAKIGG